MNKFFFMSALTATLNGRSVTQFNTLVALNQRNITASGLNNIQQSGAAMCNQESVEFTDIVINNVIFLAECTDEEFVAGTELATADEADLEAAGEVLDPKLELVVDNPTT